jgi:hypothetical protein
VRHEQREHRSFYGGIDIRQKGSTSMGQERCGTCGDYNRDLDGDGIGFCKCEVALKEAGVSKLPTMAWHVACRHHRPSGMNNAPQQYADIIKKTAREAKEILVIGIICILLFILSVLLVVAGWVSADSPLLLISYAALAIGVAFLFFSSRLATTLTRLRVEQWFEAQDPGDNSGAE